jgi:hypothetical protein
VISGCRFYLGDVLMITGLASFLVKPSAAVWVAVLLTLAAPATAADKNGRFAIKGAGLANCAQYVKQRDAKSTDFFVYAGWIDGYVTAMNRFREQTYDLAPWQTSEILAGMVGGYCAKNPDANFAHVVDQLSVNLAAKRLKVRSEMIQVVYKDQQVLIYEDVLKTMKNRLAAKGYLKPSQTDGGFNDTLAEAVIRFQRDNKLEASGLPNYLTLYRLFQEK